MNDVEHSILLTSRNTGFKPTYSELSTNEAMNMICFVAFSSDESLNEAL